MFENLLPLHCDRVGFARVGVATIWNLQRFFRGANILANRASMWIWGTPGIVAIGLGRFPGEEKQRMECYFVQEPN